MSRFLIALVAVICMATNVQSGDPLQDEAIQAIQNRPGNFHPKGQPSTKALSDLHFKQMEEQAKKYEDEAKRVAKRHHLGEVFSNIFDFAVCMIALFSGIAIGRFAMKPRPLSNK